MPRVDLDWNERFPEYSIVPEGEGGFLNSTVDLPEDKIEWCKRVAAEFQEVQDYLAALVPARGLE